MGSPAATGGPGKPDSVAIVRLTSLGDVVHTLPLAHAIRQAHPAASIVWIVEERERALLDDNPCVDRVIAAPTRRWRRQLRRGQVAATLAEYRALARGLRGLGIRVAIDVQGFLKSSLFTVLTRAPVRIGFAWSRARDPWSSLFTNRWVTPPPEATHIVDRNLALLEPLGIHAPRAVFPLPPLDRSLARADAALAEAGVASNRRLVGLLAATRGPAKQWPAAFYRRLAQRLIEELDARVMLLGDPAEEPLLRAIADGLHGRALVFTPAPILDLAGLLCRAHAVVGNDTGPLHLAAALGIPSVGLFGPTSGARNGPYGGRAIQSRTGRMEAISVDEVFAAVAAPASAAMEAAPRGARR